MITIGTCSRLPTPLVGRRVRVAASPRTWLPEEGVIEGVSGRFVLPHDGLEECACVHVDDDSSFSVSFPDDFTWHGFPPTALTLVEEHVAKE